MAWQIEFFWGSFWYVTIMSVELQNAGWISRSIFCVSLFKIEWLILTSISLESFIDFLVWKRKVWLSLQLPWACHLTHKFFLPINFIHYKNYYVKAHFKLFKKNPPTLQQSVKKLSMLFNLWLSKMKNNLSTWLFFFWSKSFFMQI